MDKADKFDQAAEAAKTGSKTGGATGRFAGPEPDAQNRRGVPPGRTDRRFDLGGHALASGDAPDHSSLGVRCKQCFT